ncbi:uncharacterized protein [Antennarius striatus]|uniref:uncharacterized protein isoform X2 n=1 Tax=Antennarius striatus TaxID=241820 RepID=UPI0035AE2069
MTAYEENECLDLNLHKQKLGFTETLPLSSDIGEDDYVPESVESESNSSPDIEQPKVKKKKKVRKTTSASSLQVQPLKKMHVPPCSSLDTNDPRESSSPDVTVMILKKKKDGGRLYNKRFYCVFCSKPYSKMPRHLECKHSELPEVEKALKYPKGSMGRKLQFDFLRNKGNHAHNTKVIKEGKGMVIPHYQTIKPAKPGDYMHCIHCQAYLKRKSLRRHMQTCHLIQQTSRPKPGTSPDQALCKYAEPVPDSMDDQFWKLVLSMQDDDITKVVRSEKCILKFGASLFSKHCQDATKQEYIRQKMRETGRVVLQGQKDGKLKMLSDFFIPANFPHVIEAVKKVAGLDEKTNVYQKPSLALKLGHNLKNVADILKCEAVISGDKAIFHNVQVFKHICDTKWKKCVSSHALRNLKDLKWNAPRLLPFAEDMRKMHQYLDRQRMECQRKLKEEVMKKNWIELAKVTLCEVILFNEISTGEVSKMLLNSFTLRDTSATCPDVELAVSEVEKKLYKHFQRIEIKFNHGRKIPILLTPMMVSSIDLLVQNRRNCDVFDINPYIFGRPQTLRHFTGSDVIRQMAHKCGVNYPEALSSNKFRTHAATMSKVLNLKDNELDDLADCFGHDIRVRQQYRLPNGTLQLAKISKLLMALERGQLSNFRGKNLDEINIDPQEKISADNASDSDDEVDATEMDTAFYNSSPKSSGQSGMITESTIEVVQSKDLPSGNGLLPKKRLKWTQEEIKAVEKTLMDCINNGKVPGKAQCMKCIKASPVVLQGRTWKGVKFYVKNRINALRRDALKRRGGRVNFTCGQDLRELIDEENHLDELIQSCMLQIHQMNENQHSDKFAYLTYDDIRSIPSFKDQTVIVIKAPSETKLEMQHPAESLQVHLRSTTRPIEVFICCDVPLKMKRNSCVANDRRSNSASNGNRSTPLSSNSSPSKDNLKIATSSLLAKPMEHMPTSSQYLPENQQSFVTLSTFGPFC